MLFTIILTLFLQTQITSPYSKQRLQVPEKYADIMLKANQLKKESEKTSDFRHLNWDLIGPYQMGGRVTDIAVPKGSYFTFYVATANGGVWKTDNNGSSWLPIFDKESTGSIGDIAVSDIHPNLIWIGSGENNSLRSGYAGTGIFKSIDGGKTWKHMGLKDSHHIGRIIIDPLNDDIVYVAVIGHLFSKNNERGVYKTSNGGDSWEKILYLNDSTGFIDIHFAPDNHQILYAAAWERSRKAWDFKESGLSSGFYKSVNAGNDWKKITQGLPTDKNVGRIGISSSISQPDVVYISIDNQKMHYPADEKDKERVSWATSNKVDSVIKGIEVYRSNDRGEHFTLVSNSSLNNDNMYSSYGYFFGNLAVDPNDPETVYTLGVHVSKSIDGGKNWKNISDGKPVHADHHAIWINPLNSRHLIIGNDGGIDISYDAGETWHEINNLPIGQFYAITVDNQNPYNVYGGMQDNGTWMGSSFVQNSAADIMGLRGQNSWKFLLGGDGFHVQVDPVENSTIYAESQWGYINRIDKNGRFNIRPKPSTKGESYRFNWSSPIILSHHNRLTVYFGGNKLFKSLNQGDQWHEISPDLSQNDPSRKGDVTFGTITSISESELDPNLLYVGTDDGNVWVSKNGGHNWTAINQNLPSKWVSRVLASRFKLGRVYLTLTGFREDDTDAYIFVSENYGENWLALNNHSIGEPVNVIIEDRMSENVLYLGSDLGVYMSPNKGSSWISLTNNLPSSPVHDLVQEKRSMELIAATHGRSIFKFQAKFISQFNDSIASLKYHSFLPKLVKTKYRKGIDIPIYVNNETDFYYEILDEKKKNIRKTVPKKLAKGIHLAYWDLRASENDPSWKIVDKNDYILVLHFGKKALEHQINFE